MDFPYDYKGLTEELLFQRYAHGDIKAFDVLLERLKGLVYSHILRFFPDQAEADDIFQDVFFKVCKNKDQFRTAISFKSWLATICRNTCIDRTRRQKRALAVLPLDAVGEDETRDRPFAEKLAADRPSPLEELTWKIEDEELAGLMDELPAEQRETFSMKVVMDLTFEEIGSAMECSVNTAKSRYRYALAALRKIVGRRRLFRKAAGQEDA